MTLVEAAHEALRYFASMDESNAAIHCGEVRYSPITLRLCEALHAETGLTLPCVAKVWPHVGAYEEDHGR